jgi:YT521-B-like domain
MHRSTMKKQRPEIRPLKLSGLNGELAHDESDNHRDNPLPFYQTRNIRNPWNRNFEVKISRDGTELEPSVGANLLAGFDGNPNRQGADLLSSHPGQNRGAGYRAPFPQPALWPPVYRKSMTLGGTEQTVPFTSYAATPQGKYSGGVY